MSENFGKLKKFFKRYTAIKCAVCGISVGLFSAGALLLILKLCSAEIFALYYALVGIGVSAAVGVPILFSDLRTEKSPNGWTRNTDSTKKFRQ